MGWRLNCRALLLSLPDDKFLAWMGDVDKMLDSGWTSHEQLELMVGRLNHVAAIIPMGRHFLNWLQNWLQHPQLRKQKLSLGKDELGDLRTFKVILRKANKGISLNLLVHRRPTAMGVSNSCPYGLGGFLLNSFAWRLRIPRKSVLWGDNQINNTLEFLAMAINILLLIRDSQEGEFDCLLVLGDNSSAIGRLHKTASLRADDLLYRACLKISRRVASEVMANDVCLSTQHIAGKKNWVADWLSYKGRRGKRGGGMVTNRLTADCPPNDVLTQQFHDMCPQLIPRDFRICQLPREITSWALRVLQMLKLSLMQDKSRPMSNTTGVGGCGGHSWARLGLTSLRCLLYKSENKSFLPGHSSNRCGAWDSASRVDWGKLVGSQWWQKQLDVPQGQWLRRTGVVSKGAPFTSRAKTSCSQVLNCC